MLGGELISNLNKIKDFMKRLDKIVRQKLQRKKEMRKRINHKYYEKRKKEKEEENIPVQNIPVKNIPVQGAPAVSVPVQSAPAVSVPAVSAPVNTKVIVLDLVEDLEEYVCQIQSRNLLEETELDDILKSLNNLKKYIIRETRNRRI
jgi:hypothetical protein